MTIFNILDITFAFYIFQFQNLLFLYYFSSLDIGHLYTSPHEYSFYKGYCGRISMAQNNSNHESSHPARSCHYLRVQSAKSRDLMRCCSLTGALRLVLYSHIKWKPNNTKLRSWMSIWYVVHCRGIYANMYVSSTLLPEDACMLNYCRFSVSSDITKLMMIIINNLLSATVLLESRNNDIHNAFKRHP